MATNITKNEAVLFAAEIYRELRDADLVNPDTLKPKRGAITRAITHLHNAGYILKYGRGLATNELAIILDDFRKMRDAIN